MQEYFLKPNVVFEPLIEGWYAWSHLVSPATAAMNVRNRHLKIMDSYIQAPQLHAAAVASPKMKGGPFMDYPSPRVEEIRKLKENTLINQSKLLELSDAILALEEMLKVNAKGYSLEALYEQVPEILKGYVELHYDLNNNPSYHFFELLLYNSEFYLESSQNIALWITENDQRPFCLSTARLEEKHVLNLNIPFRSPLIDELSKMKTVPGDIDEIAGLLNIPGEQRMLFESFFTKDAPPVYRKYEGSKVRMRYFGHACILIETKEVSILVDPLISYYGYDSGIDHFSDMDLPHVIDYVLITHNHQDHILLETLLPLRHKIKKIIVPATTSGALQDPNLKLMFESIGFDNVVEITDMQKIKFGNCAITGIPFTGEHSDLNIKTKSCYHIAVGAFTFLFVADSRLVEPKLYQHVQRLIGDIDVIFLGMECDGAPLSWLYGPLLSNEIARDKDQTRRLSGCDAQRGLHLVKTFHPKEAYVYAMGQEPWLEFISSIKYTDESNPIVQSNLFLNECKARGVIAERLFGEKEILYDYEFVLE